MSHDLPSVSREIVSVINDLVRVKQTRGYSKDLFNSSCKKKNNNNNNNNNSGTIT